MQHWSGSHCPAPSQNVITALETARRAALLNVPREGKMSAREFISVGIGNEKRRVLAKAAAGLSLAVLLLGGRLHATAITSVGERPLQVSKRLANRGVGTAAIKTAVEPVVADTAVTPHAETSAQPTTAVCILSGDCAPTVEVPEPQSLLLVGSGLLSMAGLIRRRLLR
jgi:hypothetical protein